MFKYNIHGINYLILAIIMLTVIGIAVKVAV